MFPIAHSSQATLILANLVAALFAAKLEACGTYRAFLPSFLPSSVAVTQVMHHDDAPLF
jgi:hypothetical protein